MQTCVRTCVSSHLKRFVNELFSEMDTDTNRYIDVQEFLAYFYSLGYGQNEAAAMPDA